MMTYGCRINHFAFSTFPSCERKVRKLARIRFKEETIREFSERFFKTVLLPGQLHLITVIFFSISRLFSLFYLFSHFRVFLWFLFPSCIFKPACNSGVKSARSQPNSGNWQHQQVVFASLDARAHSTEPVFVNLFKDSRARIFELLRSPWIDS
jgi:hypothetical protein